MSVRISSPVLVGRSVELGTVREAIVAAVDGRMMPVLISGEAGVGKTRLVEEMTSIATKTGMRVLHGGCASVGEGGLPYGPFVEALRGLAHELDPVKLASLIGSQGAELGRLVPALAREATPTGSVQHEWLQARLFEALLGLLQRLAAIEPTVLIIEDLHWSDAATREALSFLLRGLRDDRILVAMTYRTDDLHRRHPLRPWLAELDRNGRVKHVELTRLGAGETGELIAAITGANPADEEIIRIHRRSDGNPFFVEELLANQGSMGSSGLPSTLREILLARIASVPELTQAIVRVASVIGQRLDHDVLEGMVDLAEEDLLEGLRGAVTGQLLLSGARDGGGEDYAFRHALVQEAAYDDLLPGERRRLHRRCAEAIVKREAGTGAVAAAHWASVAHHWSAAGDDALAFEAALNAARSAEATFAFSAALQQYERVLERWAAVPDAAEVAGIDLPSLFTAAARAASLSGESGRDVALRREALTVLGNESDPTRKAVMTEQLGRALWTSGDSEGALEAYKQAVALLPTERPSPERARVLAGFGQMLMLLDRWKESLALCDEAISIARLVGAREAEGHAMNTRGMDLVPEGRCAEAVESLEAALRIAVEARNADDVGRAYTNWLDVEFFCGNTARAAEVAEEGIRVANEYGIASSYGCFIRQGALWVLYDQGRWDVAERLAMEAESLTQGGIHADRYGLSRWCELLVATGSPDATARLDRLWELVGDAPVEGQFSGPYHIARAESALWAGDPGTALDVVERGLAVLEDIPWRWYAVRLHRVGARAIADLSEVARDVRDAGLEQDVRERAARLVADRDRVALTSNETQAASARAETAAEMATAEAEDTRSRGAPDPEAWRGALAAWRARERPYLIGYVRWREAEACLATGDRGGAADALSEAASIAARLGAQPLLAAVESLAARARIRLHAGEPAESARPDDAAAADGGRASQADRFGLTAREREVLALLAKGWTNRRIADELFISENTAGVHVSHILGKLEASGRAEAAAIAVRLGLADIA